VSVFESETHSGSLGLFTDLYELTMLQAYVHEGMHDRAVFSLFVRRLPEQRNVLLACGLETVLDYLEGPVERPDSLGAWLGVPLGMVDGRTLDGPK
jgi:nicotinate phosphoribosyltransferase